jgi:hypothetical protein
MTFLLLYVVGLVNLAVGYFVMRRLQQPSVKSPVVASVDDADATPQSPGEAFESVKAELGAQAHFMAIQIETLMQNDLPVEELTNVLSEVNVAAEKLLKTINVASNLLLAQAALDPGSSMLVEELEDHWADISNAALQLVTLSFGGESDAEAKELLSNTCDQLQGLCVQASEQLRDRTVAQLEEV